MTASLALPFGDDCGTCIAEQHEIANENAGADPAHVEMDRSNNQIGHGFGLTCRFQPLISSWNCCETFCEAAAVSGNLVTLY
jgi:hypothetical protein